MEKIKRLRINLLLNYPLGVELAFFVVLYKPFFTFALIPYFILCLCVSYLIRCLFLGIKYRNVWLSPAGFFRRDGFVLAMRKFDRKILLKNQSVRDRQLKFATNYFNCLKEVPDGTIIRCCTHNIIINKLKKFEKRGRIKNLKVYDKLHYTYNLDKVYRYMGINKDTPGIEQLKPALGSSVDFKLIKFTVVNQSK